MTDEPLPHHCGYPFPPAFHAGCGCGKSFTSWHEVYRCADCGVAMHRHCLIAHFGDGMERTIDGRGRVRAPLHTPHAFAMQLAWAIEVIMQRDMSIAQLQAQQPEKPP